MRLAVRLLRGLAGDNTGTALIETAFVAPILLILAGGGVEVASMIAKHNRLLSVAEMATEIVMVTAPDTPDERSDIEEELQASLPSSATVDVEFRFRCGTGAMSETVGTCDEDLLSTYIHIAMTDSYVPTWTAFGIGSAFQYYVERTVQVS